MSDPQMRATAWRDSDKIDILEFYGACPRSDCAGDRLEHRRLNALEVLGVHHAAIKQRDLERWGGLADDQRGSRSSGDGRSTWCRDKLQ